MKEWLKNDLNLPEDFSKRITKNVLKRAKARKRQREIAIFSILFLFAISGIFLKDNLKTFLFSFPQGEKELNSLSSEVITPPSSLERLRSFNETPLSTPTSNKNIPQFEKREKLPPLTPQTGKSVDDLKFAKVDDSLMIMWEGEGEFVVYKCDTPKFDSCSSKEVVKGNTYLDNDAQFSKIVFYRVEPLKRKG